MHLCNNLGIPLVWIKFFIENSKFAGCTKVVTQQVTFGKFSYEVACSHIPLACRYLCHTSISHAPPHASQAEVSSLPIRELLIITSLLISDCRDHYKATPMDRLDENEKHHQEIVALLDKYAQKYAQQQITVSIICCMYFHIQIYKFKCKLCML